MLAVGNGYVVKQITIEPGHRLSYQYHHHRTEYWSIAFGEGMVQVGDDVFSVEPGAQIHIPALVRHRLINSGEQPLILIELQIGDRLDEGDIVRLADDYGREINEPSV